MLRVVKLIVSLIGSGILLHMASGLSYAGEKHVFGLHEYVLITDFDIVLPAKLDTGAQTSSISAIDIHEFEQDGDTWVRFRLADASDKTFELPVVRTSKIKRRAGEINGKKGKTYTARPVVELQLVMGGQTKTIETSLTDRSRFKYPFLMGSVALKKFSAVVDPALEFTSKKPVTGSNDHDVIVDSKK